MGRTTDFHSHILPGIDDGSASLEESIQMLQMAADQGVERIVATPHFYAKHDRPEKFLQKRAEAENLLRTEMKKYPGMPQLYVGAEVFFFNGISDSEVLPALSIHNTGYVLVEMPMPPWSDRMYRELENIWLKQDLIPVIAHIDRYLGPWSARKIPEKLEKLPVKVQANASFFLEKSTRSAAFRMLRREQIHLLGSDCHNLTDRAPNLAAAVKVIGEKFGPDILSYFRYHEDEILK